MLLTLEVVSPNGESLGANRRRAVGPEGVQIGRSKENDWIIPDPYISRVNARVRYVNGAFYVEGIGRNPLAVNEATNVVANNEPQLLRHGDRFFLDQYEFRVTLGSGQSAPLVEDPFAAPEPRVSRSGGGAFADIISPEPEVGDAGHLDPLAVLGAATRPPAPPPKHVELNQVSTLEQHYQAPPIVAAPPAQIPDTWDRTKMDAAMPPPRPQPAAPDAFRRPGSTPGGSAIPDAWDRTGLGRANPQPTAPMPPPRATPRPAASQTVRRPTEPVAAPRVEAPPKAAPREQPAQTDPSARLSLEQLLQSAGVPATQMTPEIAAEMGEVLRIVVQGLMDVLQSRAEIKSQLRMSMTRMQSTENNPLKFSPNIEAALHTLFVERNRGYLPTVRAFEEALLDIRNHQIAVLQGIRAAFDGMLENFDPERIDADLERQSKRGGLLSGGAKGRFRDHYVEEFARMRRDPDETFRRLFGESFAQAYEEQMERLKAAARTTSADSNNNSGRTR